MTGKTTLSEVTHPTALSDDEVGINVPLGSEDKFEAIDVTFAAVTVTLVMFVHAGSELIGNEAADVLDAEAIV